MVFTKPNAVLFKQRSSYRRCIAIGIAVGGLLAFVQGSSRTSHEVDPIVGIAQLPASIDAVLVVEDATSLRTSQTGRAVIDAFIETGQLTKTTMSWAELAKSLGWTPEKAFDELLGRRVVIAFDELTDDWGARWVVMADVDESTQTRLRKKLKLTPRVIANDARVLAGERGRFRLAVLPKQGGSSISTLLIAPIDHKSFFFETLSALMEVDDDLARLGDTKGYHQLQELERRPIRLLVQPSSKEDSTAKFFAMTAKRAGPDWIAHWSGSFELLGIAPDAIEDLHAWPWRAFERVSENALIAVMGVAGRVEGDMLGSVGRFASGLINLGTSASLFPESGPVQMFAIHRHVHAEETDADVGEKSTMALTIASQRAPSGKTSNIDKALAEFASGLAETSTRSQFDLDGAFPGAIRSVEVDLGDRADFAWLRSDNESLNVSWSHAIGDEEAERDFWWVMRLEGTQRANPDAQCLSDIAGSLAKTNRSQRAAKRISTGVMQPANLVDWLTELGMESPEGLAIFRHVEALRWDAWITDSELIEGQARMTVRPIKSRKR